MKGEEAGTQLAIYILKWNFRHLIWQSEFSIHFMEAMWQRLLTHYYHSLGKYNLRSHSMEHVASSFVAKLTQDQEQDNKKLLKCYPQ